jgi:hypothetical protein
LESVLLALREKHFEDRNAGMDESVGIPEFGNDEITRATLKDLERDHYSKIVPMVRFDGQGFKQASCLSEKKAGN